MTDGSARYSSLTALRGLEKQLRLLRREWRMFRDDPSEDALGDLRRRVHRLTRSLEALAGEVGEVPESAGATVETHRYAAGRPEPRAVVQASRDLDGRLRSTARAWNEVLHTGDEVALDELIDSLTSAAERTEVLLAALGGAGRPGSAAESPTPLHAEPGEPVETLATEIEGMLWRLQADWNLVRQAPGENPLRLLRESFLATAATAGRLRDARGRVGESRFRRSLRVGRQLSEGVHFLPYRDPFSGVYNREGFDALAGAELKRCRRYDRPFGLLLLRLSIPDLEGLRRASAAVRGELRDYDLVARHVEDLLVVGVPEGNAAGTRRVASRVLRCLRREGMAGWLKKLSYATMPADGSTLGGLISVARSRLQP